MVCLLPLLGVAQTGYPAPESWVSSFENTYGIMVTDASSAMCNPLDLAGGTGISSFIIVHAGENYDYYAIDGVELPDSTWVGLFYQDGVTERYCCGYGQYIKSKSTQFPMLAPVCSDHTYPVNGFWDNVTNQPSDVLVPLSMYFYVDGAEYRVSDYVQSAPMGPLSPTPDGKYYRSKFYMFDTLDAKPNFTISGMIKDDVFNYPFVGLRVVATNGGNVYYSNYTGLDGYYELQVPRDFTGTLTVESDGVNSCAQYSSYSHTISSLTGDLTLNISLTRNLYTVSGHIVDEIGDPVDGIAVKYNGVDYLTNTLGYYEIPGVPCGMVVEIRPTINSTYLSYYPAMSNIAFYDNTNDVDFTAYESANIISGKVSYLGAGLEMVKLALYEASAPSVIYDYAYTNAEGNYSINAAPVWSGTLKPVTGGYVYTPTDYDLTGLATDTVCNFNASSYVTVSGTAKVGTTPLNSVTVTMIVNGVDTYTESTDAEGKFAFENTVLTGDDIVISAYKSGYSTTDSYLFNDITADVDVTFNFSHGELTISGYVKDGLGDAIEGVTLTTSEGFNTTTNSDGFYSVGVSFGFTGNVVPTKEGYTFSPEYRAYADLSSNVNNNNFVGVLTTGLTMTLSGNVVTEEGGTQTPAAGAIVYCGGHSYTTDATGYFEFTVNRFWAGYISAYLSGYHFDPVIVPPVIADVTGLLLVGTPDAGPGVVVPTPIQQTLYGGFPLASMEFNPTIAGMPILVGDWISVYDGTQLLGQAQWSGPGSNFYITAFGNDDNSTNGHALSYKITSYLTGEAVTYDVDPASVVYATVGSADPAVPFPSSEDGNFTPNTTVIILAMNANADVVNITGKVTLETAEGDPLKGVTLFAGFADIANTDENGEYTLTVLKSWSGDATPYKPGYIFDPVMRTYTDLEADINEQNYIANYDLFTISGTIVDEDGNPMVGAKVRVYEGSNFKENIYTDATGFYKYEGVTVEFVGRLIPKIDGYYTVPYSYRIKDTYMDMTVNFVAIESVMPEDWENDLSDHGNLIHNLFGFYTYPYDSENHRFIPTLNGVMINDADWIGVFYTDPITNELVCSGAQQWFAEEPEFSLLAYGQDIFGDGFVDGETITFKIYSAANEEDVIIEPGDATFYSAAETVLETVIYYPEVKFKANTISELHKMNGADPSLMLDISGTVTDDLGNPMQGVMIYGATNEVLAVTNAAGFYRAKDIIPTGGMQSVMIAPAKADYTFEPESYTTVPPVTTNLTVDFVGHQVTSPWIVDPNHGLRSHTTIVPDSALVTLNGARLPFGSYIGIFYNDENGDPKCGGYMSYDGQSKLIIVYDDDSLTLDHKEGFAVGEEFQWKVYTFADDTTREMNVDYVVGAEVGGLITVDGHFTPNGLSLLSAATATDMIESYITSTLPSGVYCAFEGIPVTLTINPVAYTGTDITYHWIINNNGMVSEYEGQTYTITEAQLDEAILISAYIKKGDDVYASSNTFYYRWVETTMTGTLTVNPLVACQGSDITLTAQLDESIGNVEYQFYLDGVLMYTGDQNTLNYHVADDAEGTLEFSVTMTDDGLPASCNVTTISLSVPITSLLGNVELQNEDGETVTNVVTCENTYELNIVFSDPSVAPYCLYQWQRKGEGENEWYSIFNANSSTYMAAGYPGENVSEYRVIVDLGGCVDQIDTLEVTITWTGYGMAAVIAGEQTVCEGDAFTPLTSEVTGVATYQWNLNGTPIEGATSDTYLPVEGGVYTLSTFNGCGVEFLSNEVVVNHILVPVVNAEDEYEVCNNLPFDLSEVEILNAANVVWTIESGVGNLSDNNAVSPMFYPVIGETGDVVLKVVVTSAEPCNVEVTEFITLSYLTTPAESAAIIGDEVICDAMMSTYMLNGVPFELYSAITWRVIPEAAAEELAYVPYDNSCIVTWNEDFYGDVQLIADVNVCGIVYSYNMNIARYEVTGIEPIQGPSKVSTTAESTTYYVPAVSAAQNYVWTIEPAEAATIDNLGNTAVVNWTASWSGFATLKVYANTPCDHTDTESLLIDRTSSYISDGIEDNDVLDVNVYPNPNNGAFDLKVSGIEGDYTVQIYNYSGQVVYNEIHNNRVARIEIGNVAAGVYFVKVTNSINTIVHKIIVK